MLNKEEFLAKLEELRDQFKALVPSEDGEPKFDPNEGCGIDIPRDA